MKPMHNNVVKFDQFKCQIPCAVFSCNLILFSVLSMRARGLFADGISRNGRSSIVSCPINTARQWFQIEQQSDGHALLYMRKMKWAYGFLCLLFIFHEWVSKQWNQIVHLFVENNNRDLICYVNKNCLWSDTNDRVEWPQCMIHTWHFFLHMAKEL